MNKEQQLREKIADGFQELADHNTLFRFNGACDVGELIAQNEPGWDVTRAAFGLIATDFTDGFWARTAKKIRGYDKPTIGAAKDPEADHLVLHSMISGLGRRALQLGDETTAQKLNSFQERSKQRDERMDENRNRIADNPNIDQRELRASSLNKAKMVFQVMGCLALASPLYEKRVARKSALGILRLGIYLGEKGEQQFREKVESLLSPVSKNRDTNPLSPLNKRRRT